MKNIKGFENFYQEHSPQKIEHDYYRLSIGDKVKIGHGVEQESLRLKEGVIQTPKSFDENTLPVKVGTRVYKVDARHLTRIS